MTKEDVYMKRENGRQGTKKRKRKRETEGRKKVKISDNNKKYQKSFTVRKGLLEGGRGSAVYRWLRKQQAW